MNTEQLEAIHTKGLPVEIGGLIDDYAAYPVTPLIHHYHLRTNDAIRTGYTNWLTWTHLDGWRETEYQKKNHIWTWLPELGRLFRDPIQWVMLLSHIKDACV